MLALLVSALAFTAVEAGPMAASACTSGSAPLALTHMRDGALDLDFADQGYMLLVDGAAVSDSTELVDGETYTIGVQATADPFKGALIRADGLGMFEAGENSQVAEVCGDVPAVTHFSNETKTMLSGEFTVMGAGTILLEVTVVEVNNAAASVYSYEQFSVMAVAAKDDSSPPESAAVVLPTVFTFMMAAIAAVWSTV